MENKIKTSKPIFLAYYTLTFALVSLLCVICYFIYKKTFFTTLDGRVQHITALIYYGKYLRLLLSNFSHGVFQIPQWDFNLGLGADIIQTLHYYVIGDPFELLSVFFKPEHTVIIYNINIFLRLYCAGFAFLAYCKHHNFEQYSSFCGTFVYVFCGFTFYCAARHPYFINPMIWLPLLLLGIDRIFEKKNFLFFAFFVFISCASNFYFFYMLSIFSVIYAVVRFFFKFTKNEYKNIWKYILLAFAGYILGVCMASFIFFPAAAGFLESARTEEKEAFSLFHRLNYYIKMILGFAVAPSTFGSYSTFGYAAPVLPLTILLFKQKDKISKEIKLFFLIGIIFFTFPIFGRIFNGLSYYTNRWGFAFNFVVAIGTAHILPETVKTDFNNLKKIIIFCLAFCIFIFASSFISSDIKEQFLLPYIILFISVLILAACHYFKFHIKSAYLILILISVIFSANFRFSPKGLNYLSDAISKEDFKKLQAEYTTPFSIQDNDFFRVETANLLSTNAPAAANYKGTTYYWSITSGKLYDFYKEQKLPKISTEKSLGFLRRNDLENLLSVKYLLSPSDEKTINDIFKNTEKKYLEYNIFENTEFQPFAFSLSNSKEHLKNVKVGINSLTADSDFSTDSIVFLSIPYSKFWKAKIDGEVAELKLSHTAFMELGIPTGTHKVELKYNNKYFTFGVLVSFISILLFAAISISIRRKC